MTPIDPQRIELLDREMVAVWRNIPPAQRVRQALESNRFVRTVISCGIRDQHPDWTEEEVQTELARRMLRGSS